MPERRQVARMRVFKSAKIVLGPSSVLDCVVRDLTNDGARITIPNAFNLPNTMSVTFDNGRTCRSSRLAWRTFNEFGVEFVGTGRAA
jgi:PilZ domain